MFYPDDWSQPGTIVNDFMRTTLTQGDDGSDPNCPIVHQYHSELYTASQPTWLFMEEVQRYECIYDKFSKNYKTSILG